MADLWDDYDSDYIEGEIQYHKAKEPGLSMIEIYKKISPDVKKLIMNDLEIGFKIVVETLRLNQESILMA